MIQNAVCHYEQSFEFTTYIDTCPIPKDVLYLNLTADTTVVIWIFKSDGRRESSHVYLT